MSITEPRTAEAPAAPPPAAGFGTLSVAAILAEAARRTPDTIAIRVGEQAVDYATLWRQTRAYAGALRAQGIGPGDRVALLVPNVPDFPRGYFAVLALGATLVLVGTMALVAIDDESL